MRKTESTKIVAEEFSEGLSLEEYISFSRATLKRAENAQMQNSYSLTVPVKGNKIEVDLMKKDFQAVFKIKVLRSVAPV